MKPDSIYEVPYILDNILQLFDCFHNSFHRLVNSRSREAMLQVLLSESRTLSRKLEDMVERWQDRLPFKEACNVNFPAWEGTFERMALEFKEKTGVETAETDGMLNDCLLVFEEIISLMQKAHRCLTREIDRQTFSALCQRVSNKYGKDDLAAAEAYKGNWVNTCPEQDAADSCQFEIEMACEKIKNSRHGKMLGHYIRIPDGIKGQEASFGKFLFAYRVKLSLPELHALLTSLYRIDLFRDYQKTHRQCPPEDAQPVFPPLTELPETYVSALRLDSELQQLLKTRLETVVQRIGNRKVPIGSKWRWPHLHCAMVEEKIFVETLFPIEFGRSIHALFPDCSINSIIRSFASDRTPSNFPQERDRSIITDICRHLVPVSRELKKKQ